MAKSKSVFVCQECGGSHPKWAGKCEHCGSWNSLIEETIAATGGDSKSEKKQGTKLSVSAISDISIKSGTVRFNSGIGEFDQVLGGGIVEGSIILLAGEPGIGKSTLLLQLAASLAKKQKILYVSGEESQSQIKLRSDRLNTTKSRFEIATTTVTNDIAATIVHGDYDLVIVDSIQTMARDDINAGSGTVSQISNSAYMLQEVAKKTNTAILLVGHVTKEGNIAGPKILEHLVDVVLSLEGERFGGFKLLRGVKNRFGATHEVGIFEMKDEGLTAVSNPSEALLKERQDIDGTIVLATLEGTRPLLVEVQALVSDSPFGYPKRTASGFDLNRLNLLIAVLQKRANIKLGDKDVYVNIVGGIKVNEPAADLAIALAIASAAKGKPIKPHMVVFGEVGLSGEIRHVNHIDKRLKEAQKLGFTKAITTASKKQTGIESVANVQEAVKRFIV